MELDDTRPPDEPAPPQTLAEESSSGDRIDAKLAALRAQSDQGIDVQHRKALVAAGLFDAPLAAVKIGRFTVVRKLGAGGMGIVYIAYDEPLDRRVAVKLLRNAAPSSEARARFEREAQAMARLSHPNVVTVHEVGTHEGQIFVAMEFVEGQDLRRWMNGEERAWREVVELFRQAGEGLAAAHEAGIVHRDFKPDNVLVGNDGRVRVADFGLAHGFEAPDELPQHRAEDSQGSRLETDLTRTGALMGTPAYMAPEQYAGQRTDARGDQFSFCVALWEGLYGRRPFSGENLLELSTAVTEGELDEPPQDSEVPDWLRAIVVRGLALQPDDRWPSMRALLDAIGDDPRIRRRRVALGLAFAGAALALAGLSALAVSELRDNARQRYWNDLTEQLLDLERERGLRQAKDDATRARDATRMSVVRSYKPKAGVIEHQDPTIAAALLREVEGEARLGSEWLSTANELLGQPISRAVLSGHRGAITSLVFSPEGEWLYSASDDGEVWRWRPETGVGEVIVTHAKLVSGLALSPDGLLLASSSEDGTVRLWSEQTGQERVLARHERAVTSVVFDARGRRIASGARDGTVQVHDLDSGETETLAVGAAVSAVTFDGSGEHVLIGSRDAKARLWRVGAPRPARILAGHEEPIYFVRLLPDGRALTASDDGSARLWSLADEIPTGVVVVRHPQPISAADLLGSRIATAALDGSMRVTTLEPPYQSIALASHADEVWGLHFTSDGQSIASASFDNTARVTRADGRGVAQVFRGHRLEVYAAVVDGSGRWLATGSYDSEVRVWDLEQPRLATPLRGHEATVFTVELDAEGARAVTASHDGTARIWSMDDGTLLDVLDGRGELNPAMDRLNHAVFSPDGQHVATANSNGEVNLWDLSSSTRRVLAGQQGMAWRMAFDPSGRRLAGACFDNIARIWSVETGEELLALRGHENRVFDVEFDADGARVITASWDGSVRVWDASTGDPLAVLNGHSGKIFTLVPSPDGRVWATGSDDGTARLWPADSSDEPVVLGGHEKDVWSIAFDHGGRRVITASHDGRARIWDAVDGRLLDTLGGHANVVWDAEFLADGRIITGSGDGVIRVWSSGSDAPPLVLRGHGEQILSMVVLPDGMRLVSASTDGSAKLWDASVLSTDPDHLLERLRASTSLCLSADLRTRELGEDPDQASLAARSCSARAER